MTQVEAVYAYMKQHGSIEPLQALRDLGVYRLAARIDNLKRKGVLIKSEWVHSRSKKTGKKIRFKKYRIAK